MTEPVLPNLAYTVRPATLQDVPAIAALVKCYVPSGILLDRDEADITGYLRNFLVAATPDSRLLGCVAVRDFGNDLLEIRTLAVQPGLTGRGVGRTLVAGAVAKAEAGRENCRVFALTTTPAFFVRLGFAVVDRAQFPEKIWSDCSRCPKFTCCDETAVLYCPENASSPRQA